MTIMMKVNVNGMIFTAAISKEGVTLFYMSFLVL